MAKKKSLAEVPKELEVQKVVEQVVPVAPGNNCGPEISKSGAPKNFIIRCPKCCWSRPSSGVAADLTDIHEIQPNCKTCGKWRKFRCPKCGSPSMMKRIKGNS